MLVTGGLDQEAEVEQQQVFDLTFQRQRQNVSHLKEHII